MVIAMQSKKNANDLFVFMNGAAINVPNTNGTIQNKPIMGNVSQLTPDILYQIAVAIKQVNKPTPAEIQTNIQQFLWETHSLIDDIKLDCIALT